MYLCFCGSGFLGVYHMGVVKALATKGSRLLVKVNKYSGASAGALVACALAVKGTDSKLLQECTQFCYDTAFLARQQRLGVLSNKFSLLDLVEEFVVKLLPDDAYLTATNSLHVSVTNLKTNQNYLVSEYSSNEHLIECLLASCYIPYVTGKQSIKISGHKYMDGGLTDNLPVIKGEEGITISPFSGSQNISPDDKPGANIQARLAKQRFKVNVTNMVRGYHALFPPKQSVMELYYKQGYNDALRFLKKEGYT